MSATRQISMIVRRLRGSRGMTLAETLVGTAVGALILAGVVTTYIISVRGFSAVSNYNQIHGDGRIAVTYFAKDIRAVSSIASFSNPSNITVTIPTAFNASGVATNTATVTYSTSAGALYRYDSRTGKTDMLATNISQLTFTLFDTANSTNGVTLSTAKGIQADIKLRKTIGSRAQTEDYLSARYDMRNTAN